MDNKRHSTLDDINESVATIKSSVSSLTNMLNGCSSSKQTEDHLSNINQLNSVLNQVNNLNSMHEKDIALMKKDYEILKDKVCALDDDLNDLSDELEKKYDIHDNEINDTTASIDSLDEKIKEVIGDVNQIKLALDKKTCDKHRFLEFVLYPVLVALILGIIFYAKDVVIRLIEQQVQLQHGTSIQQLNK